MRVAKASAELATAPLFDVIIENDNLETALAEAETLVVEFFKPEIIHYNEIGSILVLLIPSMLAI